MTEIWKDIKGYEGLYQVSNLGRCRSLDKDIPCSSLFSDKKSLVRKGKILSDKRLSHVGGYIKHRLTKDKKTKQYYLHKLVAEAFIPNPENKKYVDHIDTNRLNNQVNNLRWVTIIENNNNPKTLKNYKKRHFTQKRYIYKGESAIAIALRNGIKTTTFYRRVKELNWSVEKALSTPVILRNK